MNNHFIKNIEIRDFKCFDAFQADGFARVNLIGGKNNVGKTALMEACYVNLAAQEIKSFSTALIIIKYRRERLNHTSSKNIDFVPYLEKASNIFLSSNKNSVFFKVIESGGIKQYKFSIGEKDITVNANDFSLQVKTAENINFMSSLGSNDTYLLKRYSSLQKKDKEEYLNSILKTIDSRIGSFKIIEDVPQCKVNSKYIELTDMGEGVRHLISIVASLYASENGYLFIDEINNGIHYTMLDSIWNIILTLSKELDVQVFSTTHSKECIESYARVAKKLKDKDITYTILTKLKDGSIDAGVYNSKMLINALEQDHEIRGW